MKAKIKQLTIKPIRHTAAAESLNEWRTFTNAVLMKLVSDSWEIHDAIGKKDGPLHNAIATGFLKDFRQAVEDALGALSNVGFEPVYDIDGFPSPLGK